MPQGIMYMTSWCMSNVILYVYLLALRPQGWKFIYFLLWSIIQWRKAKWKIQLPTKIVRNSKGIDCIQKLFSESNIILIGSSEWPNVKMCIRSKPKAEYSKIFDLWANTEFETKCWIQKIYYPSTDSMMWIRFS